MAEGLGVELDEIKEVFERRPAKRRFDIQGHIVEPGTLSALRFEVQCISSTGDLRSSWST